MTEEEAKAFVAARCTADRLALLETLALALTAENERQNLVSRGSHDVVWNRHIADSAQLLDHVPRETGVWLDLGSGAGFPGLVLAVMRPHAELHLVESRRKRIDWLQEMVDRLQLRNCTIRGARIEQIDPYPVDAITARAFAPLEKLLSLSAAFSTATTSWVLPKGRSAAQELQMLPESLKTMFHVEQSRTGLDATILVGQGAVPVAKPGRGAKR